MANVNVTFRIPDVLLHLLETPAAPAIASQSSDPIIQVDTDQAMELFQTVLNLYKQQNLRNAYTKAKHRL